MIDEIFKTFNKNYNYTCIKLFSTMLNLYCDKNNIPIFGTTDSKVDNINIFTNSSLIIKANLSILKQIREKNKY